MLQIQISSGAGIIGQLMATIPHGLSLTPPHEILLHVNIPNNPLPSD
jgi:hypothetical protein